MTGPRQLLGVFRTFLGVGATTFGGMWAATGKLERDLVDRTGWLPKEELRASFVLATLIPAPRFLGLGGLVGFRVGGWAGAFLGALGLVLPASLLVLAAAVVVGPELLGGPLAPLIRAVSIAIVGILFGNAYRQLRGEKGSRRHRQTGIALSAAIFVSVVLGAPLLVSAVVGFVVGALLLRPGPTGEDR
ncbi:chromate transporter [Blastococcus sp. DSM 46786]|uniref:chromate transporter n=1 Tax=Blastococcus sp. DSM 46786 TaxID=1798227 RepID=UPI0008C8AE8A|nr:chromate transporter [Blastococcus sp. DSM 46786]SEK92212.1 chromate transporter [Blastococcus sp. DSM 46786]